MEIRLSTGQRKFEITNADGETFVWQYDVVRIKLIAESLEARHELKRDGNEVSATTPEFIKDFAGRLRAEGLKDCTDDAAYYVYGIVNAQFAAISEQLSRQVNEVLNTWQT
jgi:hypothetical protein